MVANFSRKPWKPQVRADIKAKNTLIHLESNHETYFRHVFCLILCTMDLKETFATLEHYLKTIQDRRVFPSPEDLKLLKHFDEAMPQHSTPMQNVLDMLDHYGSPNTVASQGGRYFGFVTGGVIPSALAAKLLGTAWDQNNGPSLGSPLAAKLEGISLEWLRQLFSLPEGSTGAMVTGATMASFVGLASARHALLKKTRLEC